MAKENNEALTQEAIISANAEEIEKVVEVKYKIGQYQFDALITKIQKVKAKYIFGEATIEGQEEKIMLRIHFKVVGKSRPNVPEALTQDGITVLSNANPSNKRSNLFKFNARYGQLPEKGLTIKIENNENGYWKLIL